MTSLLYKLIEEDYGIEGGGNRYQAIAHDSLVFNPEKDIYYWNSRHLIGDAYHYLTEVRGWPHNQAKDLIKSSGGEGTFIHIVKNGNEVVTCPKLVEVFHENLKGKDKSFFTSRTITESTIDRFQLGWYNDFYTIPIFQDGLFRQIQMRRDYPKKLIRKYYRYENESFLFNSDILKLVDRVYFTESPISCIVAAQNGFPSISVDSGSGGFKEEWFPYFLHVKEINILFDNDVAGVKGAQRVAKILGQERCKIYTFSSSGLPKYGLDDWFIDERSAEELQEEISKNSKYLFEMPKEDNKRRY